MDRRDAARCSQIVWYVGAEAAKWCARTREWQRTFEGRLPGFHTGPAASEIWRPPTRGSSRDWQVGWHVAGSAARLHHFLAHGPSTCLALLRPRAEARTPVVGMRSRVTLRCCGCVLVAAATTLLAVSVTQGFVRHLRLVDCSSATVTARFTCPPGMSYRLTIAQPVVQERGAHMARPKFVTGRLRLVNSGGAQLVALAFSSRGARSPGWHGKGTADFLVGGPLDRVLRAGAMYRVRVTFTGAVPMNASLWLDYVSRWYQ